MREVRHSSPLSLIFIALVTFLLITCQTKTTTLILLTIIHMMNVSRSSVVSHFVQRLVEPDCLLSYLALLSTQVSIYGCSPAYIIILLYHLVIHYILIYYVNMVSECD
jgi:hypothetical protein